jgi:hypothetical protein
MSTLNDISSCIGTPGGLVLVCAVLTPIICKKFLGFLIDLIEQILHTIKVGEILWSQTYTHNGALREIETSQEKSETRFWRSCCVD